MTQLALATSNPHFAQPPSLQWAHDIRNALATIGLHLETLERLAGPRGSKAASAAQALIGRATGMCGDAMADASRQSAASRRRGFDLVKTIAEVTALLSPAAPDGFEFRVDSGGSCVVLGEPTDIFRILFNLAQNAVTVARQGGRMSHVCIALTRTGRGIAVRVSDDGPGLPKKARAGLFRAPASGGNGHGLAIARELAERNGGRLSLADSAAGATFLLELPDTAPVEIAAGAAMPSLGRRISG